MSPRGTILLVDDESYVRDGLAELLRRRGFTVRTANSVDEALQPDTLAGLDGVITDLKMPEKGGLELVQALKEREPHLPVVVLTAYGTVASAVECLRAGAVEYLLKPTQGDELVLALDRVLGSSRQGRELRYLRARRVRDPIGESAAWTSLMGLAALAAPTETTVLLVGETGSGKEEVARFIHRNSARSDRAFVAVNCAALPLELFESEFFGHKRGAFTGATSDRDGRLRVAHGGTLFLDEINSLPLAAQAKILRVLADGQFERLGDSKPTRVDVRWICAANHDLRQEAEAGRFRVDLLYRINVLTLDLPPLRARRDDIPRLAEAFLAELAPVVGKKLGGFEKAALAALVAYDWPGNVRELRNVVERAVLLEKTEQIHLTSLPPLLAEPRPTPATAPGTPAAFDLKSRKAAAEKTALLDALAATAGHKREAARLLGIDERNLAYFLRKHGLHD